MDLKFNLEEVLVDSISERCLRLRKEKRLKQSDIASSGPSYIEGKKWQSGNFISRELLNCYCISLNVSEREIIFGNDKEIEELISCLFVQMFHTYTVKDIFSSENELSSEFGEKFYITLQKSIIELASCFAQFNKDRYEFIKSNDPKFSYKFFKTENFYKLWLILKDSLISSFKKFIEIDRLFENFEYRNLNQFIRRWIELEVINNIFPRVQNKLGTNKLFKIGYMVNDLINNFLDTDLPLSFQETVPLKLNKGEEIKFNFSPDSSMDNVNLNFLIEKRSLEKEIMKIVKTKSFDDVHKEMIEKLENDYHTTILRLEEKDKYVEGKIDTILNNAVLLSNHNLYSNDVITILASPTFYCPDNKSLEEIDQLMDDNLDILLGDSVKIPGMTSNNSQILNELQKKVNQDVQNSIDTLIRLQNYLLSLIEYDEFKSLL